jgi:formaldehyde-activating enzyme involved in methanogenesis
MNTYLVMHANRQRNPHDERVTGVAQARVKADSEAVARNFFQKHRPQRVIVAVGVKGR